MAVAHGEATFVCVIGFPRVKLPRGNFHGYVKKNKRITHDSSRGREGAFHLVKNFRKFRFGSKWNMFRRFVLLENSREK